MDLALEIPESIGHRITYAGPISDQAFIAIADGYSNWRAELDGDRMVVLMPPHGNDSSARNAALIAKLYNWNAALPEPGVVFDSDTRFRWPDGSLRGPDCGWMSAQRYRRLTTAGKAFGTIIPEIVIEVRSLSDRWTDTVERCKDWVQSGALHAIAIDPYDHQISSVPDIPTAATDPEFAEVEQIAKAMAKQ